MKKLGDFEVKESNEEIRSVDFIQADNWMPMYEVREKPIVVHATQLNFSFKVTTIEGEMSGKAGDYLVIGVDGEKYPVDKDIFEKTYDIVGGMNK